MIGGYVDIFQFDPKKYKDKKYYENPLLIPEKDRKYLVKNAKNMLVKNWWIGLYDTIFAYTESLVDYTGASVTPNYRYNAIVIDFAHTFEGVKVGYDTSTKTDISTYTLANESGIDPDTHNVAYGDNWIYCMGTWNAGKITNQVGEIGLYANCYDGSNSHKTLIARLASADGSFDAFTPDSSLPLSVVYKIKQ